VATEFHLNRMALLGRRVAELHRALCRTTGDAAFDPEPLTPSDFDGWKSRVAAELEETFRQVEAALPRLPEKTRGALAPLREHAEALRRKVREARANVFGVVKTRYHGDLHLGQVLVAQDDFIIVDFEGEPGRSLEERRAKTSVLRDVAGMVRSFSYAAHAAALRAAPGTVTDEGRHALGDWERDALHYFLEGYMKAAEGVASVPSDAVSFRATLDLFLIEKGLYELRYEMANRPDWVEIPLRGLLELAA
jgi:maltose alpha-D-glucosyltransferase/alpha-amylase